MGFASAYLKQRALFPEIIKEAPHPDTGIIIVVPAYNEPGISKLLDSLHACDQPECKVEVIIVINAPQNASAESIQNNILTEKNIASWKKVNKNCFFRLFYFNAGPTKDWGVGLARKSGMDEAVRRFENIGNQNGIILNVDADCTVSDNYLLSIFEEFSGRKNRSACSIYFEHPLSGDEFPEKVYHNIILYELHLRYYYQGLLLTGYPYVFHTVGSAIAVRALAYVKAGGMNRKQAGEDFYFIQKLVPAGGFFYNTSTTVYPSPRPSFRVPFGTGASISKMNEASDNEFYTYDFEAFKELRDFFRTTELLFEAGHEKVELTYENLPATLKEFLGKEEYLEKINEVQSNTSGFASFRKRFYGWFNMFKIIKYLNFVHQGIFQKKPVQLSAGLLLTYNKLSRSSDDPKELLLFYRGLEKSSQPSTCFSL